MYYVLCTMYYVLCTMYYVLCTMYYVLCTTYYVLCTMYYVLCTRNYIYYFIHYVSFITNRVLNISLHTLYTYIYKLFLKKNMNQLVKESLVLESDIKFIKSYLINISDGNHFCMLSDGENELHYMRVGSDVVIKAVNIPSYLEVILSDDNVSLRYFDYISKICNNIENCLFHQIDSNVLWFDEETMTLLDVSSLGTYINRLDVHDNDLYVDSKNYVRLLCDNILPMNYSTNSSLYKLIFGAYYMNKDMFRRVTSEFNLRHIVLHRGDNNYRSIELFFK